MAYMYNPHGTGWLKIDEEGMGNGLWIKTSQHGITLPYEEIPELIAELQKYLPGNEQPFTPYDYEHVTTNATEFDSDFVMTTDCYQVWLKTLRGGVNGFGATLQDAVIDLLRRQENVRFGNG